MLFWTWLRQNGGCGFCYHRVGDGERERNSSKKKKELSLCVVGRRRSSSRTQLSQQRGGLSWKPALTSAFNDSASLRHFRLRVRHSGPLKGVGAAVGHVGEDKSDTTQAGRSPVNCIKTCLHPQKVVFYG